MERYVCMVCGYVYDPGEGDLENDVEPETLFDDMPDEWVCPECGAGKDEFEELTEDMEMEDEQEEDEEAEPEEEPDDE